MRFLPGALKTTRIDPLKNKEITLCDVYGNVLQKTRLDKTDNILKQETYCYDLCRRMTSLTTEKGVLHWEWDAMGQLIRCIDTQGRTTAHTYNTFRQRISTTFPNQIVFHYEYDALNRIISQRLSYIRPCLQDCKIGRLHTAKLYSDFVNYS